jgi:hypothetical protein
MNLITPESGVRPTVWSKEGITVSLARPWKRRGADNPDPFIQKMTLTGLNNPGQFASDTYTVSYHGHAHTHMDSLGHMFYKGKMFNGVPQETITAKGRVEAGRTESAEWSCDARESGRYCPTQGSSLILKRGPPFIRKIWMPGRNSLECDVGAGDAVIIRTGTVGSPSGQRGLGCGRSFGGACTPVVLPGSRSGTSPFSGVMTAVT